MLSLHVGIDVSLKANTVVFTDETATTRLARFTVPNDAGGAVRLVNEAAGIMHRHKLSSLRVAMEATGVYAWHLAVFLYGSEVLRPFDTVVYLVQPRAVKNHRKSFGSRLPKTDGGDAWLLAEYLGHPRLLPRPFCLEERTIPLQRLTRHRYHLVHQLTQTKNYAASYVFLKASGLAQDSPLSDPFGAAAADILLEYSTVEELAAAPLTQLVHILNQSSHGHISDPEAIARAYMQAAHDSYRLPGALKEPVHQILSLTLQDIRYFQKQVKAVDHLIQREPLARQNRLLSIPGIGPVFSAGILAEVGNIRNFPDDDQVAQFAGLTWPANQSADFDGDDRPLARTGNAYLRYYFIEAANSVRRYDASFAVYYTKKFKEATTHRHKRALVLTARKLVRLVFALLRDDRAYEEGHRPVFKPNAR